MSDAPKTPEQKLWYVRGLQDAHAAIMSEHECIEARHRKRFLFGSDLVAASRALRRVGDQVIRIKRAVC